MKMMPAIGISFDLIEMHFTNKKRSGVSSFVTLYEKNFYYLIKFENKEQIKSVLSHRHFISNHELIVEYLHNYQLLEEILRKIEFV